MTIYSNKPRFRPLRLIWTEYLFGLLVGFCALFLSFGSAMGLEQALSFDSVVAESVDYVALAEAEKTDSDMPALPVLPIVASSADTEAQVAPNTVGPPIPTIAPINIPTDNTSSGNVTVPPQPVSTSPVVPIISAPTSPVQNNHAPANNRAKIDRAPAIWLQDRDGRMTIPLPNWTIEDIEEMLSSVAKKEVTSPIQPFTIQSINVDGQVIGDIARLKIEYRIHLPDISAGTPIRIPLGLKEGVSILEGEEAQFFDAIKYTGNGLYSIEYNDSLGGYIAVISVGETDANIHTLSLSLSFPVERLSGGEYRLRATFPPALHAKLRLVIPIPDIQIQTGQGIVAMPPITLNETSSEVVLGGLNRSGGPTEIVWFRVGGQTPRQRTGFQVEDAQFDAVVGIRDIQYSVRLPIRIHGGSADLFQIRLPVGTEIVRDSVVATGSGNTIIEVRDIVENQSTRVVDILLTQKVTESLLLQFKARTQLENNDDAGESPLESAKNEWDLGGFELMSAQKQFGRVRIQFSDDINYRVTPIAGVRPQLDSSSDSTENYRFYTQPFSLKVLTYAQAARIRVKPEYHVLVEQGKLELRLFLRYSIH